MASLYWKRMRQKAVEDRPDAAPWLDSPNPWVDEPGTVIDLDQGPVSMSHEDRSSQYNEWAERMRQKRERTRETIKRNADPGAEEMGDYWSTDALYADSKRVEEEELTSRPNPWRVNELLAFFNLDESAAPSEVNVAYRKLAKKHHPDRFVNEDEETQQFHADKMTDINKAYQALKQLERA